VVQVAPGEFYTVAEVEENGWGMPSRPPVCVTADNPRRHKGLPVSQTRSGRSNLKRPAPQGPVQHSAKRVATDLQSSRKVSPMDVVSLVAVVTNRVSLIGFSRLPDSNPSTPNGAGLNTPKIIISEVDQCPNFWAMPVHALYEWRNSVTILDRCILGYYEQALKDAEDNLDRAISEAATADTPTPTPSGRAQRGPSGRKRASHANRVVKEETATVGGTDAPAFKFKKDSPNRLDLIFMRALEALSPFGTNGQKGKVFHECALWLKTNEATLRAFGEISDSPNSRVLQVRYTQLKTWLAAAEGWSKMDSGTDEDDEELRTLIRSVQDEEETGRALKLAGKEEREAVKGRALLAEAVREELATKAVKNFKASVNNGDDELATPSSSKRPKRSSTANTTAVEMTTFTGELARWNKVSLAAQTKQNSRINLLYERELGIAQDRIENERLMAQSQADHQRAELALQAQRLEFDKDQVSSSKNTLQTLEAKIIQ
ncbi:hypothetical protein DFH28DRAFT_1143780, partial [Melampsora americana]